MRADAGPGCFGGCLVMFVCFLVGAPLSLLGYFNIRTRAANNEVRKMSLGEAASTRADTPLWVEVSGVPVEGSHFTMYDVPFMLLLDPEGKVAVYVMPEKDSPLLSGGGERRVVRGMLVTYAADVEVPKEFEEELSRVRRSVPPGVKMSNVSIGEGKSPPGWLASWGLGALGAFILLIPVGAKMGGGR